MQGPILSTLDIILPSIPINTTGQVVSIYTGKPKALKSLVSCEGHTCYGQGKIYMLLYLILNSFSTLCLPHSLLRGDDVMSRHSRRRMILPSVLSQTVLNSYCNNNITLLTIITINFIAMKTYYRLCTQYFHSILKEPLYIYILFLDEYIDAQREFTQMAHCHI